MDVQLLVAVSMFVAIVAAGLAGISSSRIKNLRDDNTDLRSSRDDMRFERDEARAGEALKDAELGRKEGELATLRASLTGKVEWSEVVRALSEHDARAAHTWAAILEKLAEIRAAQIEAKQ